METMATYTIEGTFYELYKAASGDYCVSVEKYGQEPEHYNLGSKEEALAFILDEYGVVVEEVEE